MSIDHSPLPGFLAAELFRNSLVYLEEETQPVSPPLPEPVATPLPEPVAAVPYLGQNSQHIMIAVHTPGHPFLAPESLEFLLSILKACQRNMDHVAIVNFAKADYTPEALTAQLNPRMMMLFGAYPLFSALMDNQIDFTLTTRDQIQIMRAPALETMLGSSAESRALKGKLWLMLKQLFNL